MRFPVLVSLVVALTLDCSSAEEPSKCPIPVHYKEIGCTPIIKDGEECASSYNCDHLQKQNTTGCHFRGRHYADFEPADALPRCVPYANCIEDGGYFRAGHIDCGPSYYELPGQKCVEVRNGCCPETVCGEEAINNLTVCYADGEKHYKGERWTPKEDKCIECTCDEHFDNSTSIYKSKNCKVEECFQDFWHLNEYRKGCGPVYYGKDRCCASETKCPSANDQLIKAATTSTSDLKCKFGELELSVGDGIKHETNNCLDCLCLTPPLIECQWRDNCERIYN